MQKEENGAALLSLPAGLQREETHEALYGGEMCSIITRTYLLEDGLEVKAVSASPGGYFERLSQDGFVPQLVTGFTLAGLDAVYERRGETGLLAAKEGDRVYLLEADTDEQTLYTLGADAKLDN